MPGLPGNRLNDLWGGVLGRLALHGGARRWRLHGGRVVVYDGCGGLVARYIRALNSGCDAAVAVGHVVLYTQRFDLSMAGDRWLLAHELAHVAQAERLGFLFLPVYALGLVPAVVRWLLHRLRGRRGSFHDLHPMEEAANRAADREVPEAARPRG